MRSSQLRAPSAILLLTALGLSACGDGESPPVPGSLTASAGDQQAAVVGTTLPTAPAVLLKDTKGRPMNGVTVTFAVASGGGSLAGAAAIKTGADGVARAGIWTLGTSAAPNTLTATVQGLAPVVFTATANAGAPSSVNVTAGDGQTAMVGSAVAVAPTVVVKDNFGNVVPNTTVVFATPMGGGSVVGGTASTDAAGTASVGGWTLGTLVGLNTLTATTDNGTAATFTATGTPGQATQMSALLGNGQTNEVSSSVPVSPAVLVRDQYGNPVGNVVVTFSVGSGGGSVTGAVQSTAPNGVAGVGAWQLGPTPGVNTLIAQAAGVNPVTFTATATEVLVLGMTMNAGDAQSAPAGWTVGVAPSVVIRDQFGNGIAGEVVEFNVVSGNGSITGGTATTGANGVATIGWWRLGSTTGVNTLTATSNGLSDVTFTATAVQPPQSSDYNISIAYLAPPTARQHQAVLNAVTRWQQIIIDDLSDFPNLSLGATGCTPTFVNETIDDILVLVDFSLIDGPGNVLGQAGPCLVRSSTRLTIAGKLRLDAADLANMETNGTIDDVVLHEIGHILGIGSLWTDPAKNLLRFGATDSSTFIGAAAAAAFIAGGGNGFSGAPVPAENCKNSSGIPIPGCGSGTRDVHWREAVLARELMTGYISPSGLANPLSAITIQSLADLGYAVNPGVADGFTVGVKPIPGAEPPPIFLNEVKPNWTIHEIDHR